MNQQKPLIDCTKEDEWSEDDLCIDYDDECHDVSCAVSCWLHAPENGICPMIKQKQGISE